MTNTFNDILREYFVLILFIGSGIAVLAFGCLYDIAIRVIDRCKSSDSDCPCCVGSEGKSRSSQRPLSKSDT